MARPDEAKMVAMVRSWPWLGMLMPMVLRHLRKSAWLYLMPMVAACVPIGVLRAYFERSLRRLVRRVLPFFDPFITVDMSTVICRTGPDLDKLDAALIRRGRMDLHIEMSYYGFEAFKTLAKNYIGVDAHPLFATVEELLQATQITPADVAECLMASRRSARDADACMSRLVDELIKTAKKSTAADVEEDKDDVSLKRAKDNAEIGDAAAKPNGGARGLFGGSDGSSDVGDGSDLGDGSYLEDDCSSYDSDDSY